MKKKITKLACIIMAVAMALSMTSLTAFADGTGITAPKVSTSVTSSTVTLKWDKLSGAGKYHIYRSTSVNGTYKKIKTTTALSYKNTRLTNGRMYFYKVRAQGTISGKTAYSPYTKVAATPLGVPICKSSSMVAMNKVRTDGVKKATGYAVYRSASPDSGYTMIGKTTSLAYDDKTAQAGVEYFYKMRAYKSGSGYTTYGPDSAKARGTRLLAAPETTVEMIADENDETKNVMSISWTAVEAAEGYELWRSSDEGKNYRKLYSGQDLSYIDTTCEDGVTYYYKVRGYQTVYGYRDYGYSSPSKHSRAKMVAQGKAWLGYSESNRKYKTIVDVYNGYKPLPRDIKGEYKEAWCTTFVTACAIKSGTVDIIPRERVCRYMIDLCKETGIWVERDSYVPKSGDYIMYDWQDSGRGDCTGAPNHIGMVTSVSGNKIIVLEGNNNRKSGHPVSYRTVTVNSRYIRGFVAPKYDVQNGVTFVLNRVVESRPEEEPEFDEAVEGVMPEQDEMDSEL